MLSQNIKTLLNIECAVVGIPDNIKGEAPVVFVVRKKMSEIRSLADLKTEIVEQVRKEISPIALPREVYLVEDLLKTRGGKIMRKILKKILINDENLGDLSALANPEAIAALKKTLFSYGRL